MMQFSFIPHSRHGKRPAAVCLAALCAVLLTGCAAPAADAPPVSQSDPAPQETALAPSGLLPVLAIESREHPDSLDFVTQPVAEHVAASIASWTPGYQMPPAPYYEPCRITLTEPDGTLLLSADADVKVRGNWTTTYDKKPLRLKFDEQQNLLGLHDGNAYKNWLLLADYKDASLLRNRTALTIANEILSADGLYAADTAFTEVTVNGAYWGLYILSEHQQIAPHRVDITKAKANETGTNIGYFLEFDGYYTEETELQSFFVDYADNAPLIPFTGDEPSDRTISPLNEGHGDRKQNVGMTIKNDLYSQEQHDFIASYVNNVYRVMYAAAYEDRALRFTEDGSALTEAPELTPQEAVEACVNVDSLADMYLISELTCDADIYWSSFFMDVDFGEGGDKRLTFEAPWDFDSALGNKERCPDGTGFYAANIVPDVNDSYETINPWLAVLMQKDWFRDIIREKWTRAYESGVFDRALAQIASESTQYQAAFECDAARWDSLLHNSAANEWSRRSKHCRTHAETADYLSEWLQTRVTFLNDYWHSAPDTPADGQNP